MTEPLKKRGRPKGTPNKKAKKIDPKVEAELKAMEPGLTEEAKKSGWKMQENGDISAPIHPAHFAELGICSECHHPKDMHYGSKTDWCNTPNCNCGAWK